jgi:RHS repeat-associated protein
LSRDFNSDNFDYICYEGTNRLARVYGYSIDNYEYDYNGNLTDDALNDIAGIKYDYRNLITEMCYHVSDEENTYKVVYKYDEAGNRIRKTALRLEVYSTIPDYCIWSTVNDEFYVRDVSGKEIAKYSGNVPEYINIWGNDLVGRMSITGNKYYYLKDHLGSIRAVLRGNSIIEGRDYDPWGYVIREYDVSNMDECAPNKFTGKERDWESGYDYFGARYYDSRIGRWGQTEKVDKMFYNNSPYSYAMLNPMLFEDILGLYPRIIVDGNNIMITTTYYYVNDKDDAVYGINDNQAMKIEKMITNMNSWGGTFEYGGKKYNLTVNVKLEEVNGKDYSHMTSEILSKNVDGFNFLLNMDKIDNDKTNQGVAHEIGGNALFVTKEMSPYMNTGAHEFGHCLRLLEGPQNNDNTKIPSIMQPVDIYPNGIIKRNDPGSADRYEVYKKYLEK